MLNAQPSSNPLPSGLRAELDKSYPGWRFAAAAPQIREWFRQSKFGHEPNLIAADFDADGAGDYVLQIHTRQDRQVVIAFLNRQGRFESHVLVEDPPDAFVYLLLFPKRTKDFDFAAMKPFRYANHSVAVMYFNRTPLVFSYWNGAFRERLMLNDEEQPPPC